MHITGGQLWWRKSMMMKKINYIFHQDVLRFGDDSFSNDTDNKLRISSICRSSVVAIRNCHMFCIRAEKIQNQMDASNSCWHWKNVVSMAIEGTEHLRCWGYLVRSDVKKSRKRSLFCLRRPCCVSTGSSTSFRKHLIYLVDQTRFKSTIKFWS